MAHWHNTSWSQFSFFGRISNPIPATDANRAAFPAIPPRDHSFMDVHWGEVTLVDEEGLGRAQFIRIPTGYVLGAYLILPVIWGASTIAVYRRN